MLFNENSGLVQIWVRLLTQNNSPYTINNVPEISNLRFIVLSILGQ